MRSTKRGTSPAVGTRCGQTESYGSINIVCFGLTGRFASEDPLGFADPTGLLQAGNPLANLAGSITVSAGGYSGGRISDFRPTSTALLSGPSQSQVNDIIFGGPSGVDLAGAPLLAPAPSRQVSSVTEYNSTIYGDYALAPANFLANTVQTTTSPTAAFFSQLFRPAANIGGFIAKTVIDTLLPPTTDPTKSIRYDNGDEDVIRRFLFPWRRSVWRLLWSIEAVP